MAGEVSGVGDTCGAWAAHAPHQAALQAKVQTVQASGAWQEGAAQAPASPCIGVCQLDAQQHYCVGCLRNLPELQAWGRADAQGQRVIWQRILARAAQVGG